MPRQKTKIKTAAEYICVNLFPENLRSSYVRDIRVYYHAEAIVYALQALSAGMTGLFVGLITNYLYDKTKKPDQKLVDMEALLKKQQGQLQELENLLVKEKDRKFLTEANQQLELHKQTILQIQESDPRITEMIEDALKQLEQKGQKAIDDEIDSNFR